MKEEIKTLFSFLTLIDEAKNVFRRNYIADGTRHENDAEHSWHLALAVMLLKKYSAEPIDECKTIKMVLIHDLIEIYSGDTYCYDANATVGQGDREATAAKKIFGQLPEEIGSEFLALWEEFEAWQTPEAKFAKSMDRLQPVLLNIASDGKSWKENGIRFEQIRDRNVGLQTTAPELWSNFEEELKRAFDVS